jgi:hypothetical protein
MKDDGGKLVAVALVTGGLSTSFVLARFGALGVPDTVSHRQVALLAVDAAAVIVGVTGMILLAVRVIRAAPDGYRLTRRYLVGAGVGRPLVAVGGVVLVQHLLPWWRRQLASGSWLHSQAHAGLLRWAPTEVVAAVAVPLAYLLFLLTCSTWEGKARRPPVSTAVVTNVNGIGPLYRSTWWVCPTCDRVFTAASSCNGTAVWAHDEVAAAVTTKDWRVSVPAPMPVVSRSYDSYLDGVPAHRGPVRGSDDEVIPVDLG